MIKSKHLPRVELRSVQKATSYPSAAVAMLLIASPAFAADQSMSVAAPAPAALDEYAIHEDGGLIYDPLRREAARTGQLAHCAQTTTQTGKVATAKVDLSQPYIGPYNLGDFRSMVPRHRPVSAPEPIAARQPLDSKDNQSQ